MIAFDVGSFAFAMVLIPCTAWFVHRQRYGWASAAAMLFVLNLVGAYQ